MRAPIHRRPLRPLAALSLAAGLALAWGCRATPAASPPLAGPLPSGTSVEGRPIPYRVVGEGSRTVLLLATIHGDEAAGTPLLEELLRRVDAEELPSSDVRLVVVPVANPDGRAANTRHNAHGVDLNRNFPARSFDGSERHGPAPLSEPESAFLAELVRVFAPERVLSFHQPVGCIDYDGPAASLAHGLAAVSPLPVRRLGGRPGSLGSWIGRDLGRPIVTVELPRSDDRRAPEELWRRYGALLLEALR